MVHAKTDTTLLDYFMKDPSFLIFEYEERIISKFNRMIITAQSVEKLPSIYIKEKFRLADVAASCNAIYFFFLSTPKDTIINNDQ